METCVSSHALKYGDFMSVFAVAGLQTAKRGCDIPPEEIAAECNLSLEEVQDILM